MIIKGYKRYISIILVITFSITVFFYNYNKRILPYINDINNIIDYNREIEYEQVNTKTIAGKFSDETSSFTNELENSINNNDIDKFKNDIKIAENKLENLKSELQNEFEENEKIIEKLNNSNLNESNNKFQESINEKIYNIESLFAKINEILVSSKELSDNDITIIKDSIVEISNYLDTEVPEQSTGTLPHKNITVTPKEPSIDNGITPAYYLNEGEYIEGELSIEPTQDDINQTLETKLSNDIKNKADELDSALNIYEFVKNSIDFEPYFGSRKGAEGTLNQMSGNDYDQASLLISMLRYKNIPSRYVRGTIELPIEDVMNWTGGENPEAAVKILGSLGIPVSSGIIGGNISVVRIEHVWVEAYIPYEDYRGVGNLTGESLWIPLDPSYKKYEKVDGIDFEKASGFSREEIIEALNVIDVSNLSDTITKLDTSKTTAFLDNSINNVTEYIKDNKLDVSSFISIVGGRRIIEENLGLLPLTLPYKTLSVQAEFNKVDDEYSDRIGFSIKGADPFGLNFNGNNDFDISYKSVELYGKRITLSWTPASKDDEDVINAYGGIFNTPAYLINLRPVLKVDGEVVAEGKGVGLGYRQEFTINMINAGVDDFNISNPVIVGGYYSVGLDYGTIDTKELETISDRLLNFKDNVTNSDLYTDEVIGEILNSISKSYFGQVDAFDKIIKEANNVSSVRLISEAMTGYRPNVKYMFLVPVEIVGGSYFIDVDNNVFGCVSNNNEEANTIQYMMNSGIMASSLEHGIFEEIFQLPSVSTIKVLEEANRRGIPIYSINSENLDKVNELNISESVKSDIIDAVNSGKVVIIPKNEITYYEWNGSGYIIIDPETGAAGYMISGGIAGGSIAFDVIVGLAGVLSIAINIMDIMAIVQGLLLSTNPYLAVVVAYGILMGLSFVACINTIDDMYNYWTTGDSKYASNIIKNLVLDIGISAALKGLSNLLPSSDILSKNVINNLDGISDVISKYGDDVADVVARYGDEGLEIIRKYGDDAARIIKRYGDDGLISLYYYGDDLIKHTTKYGDEVVEWTVKYGEGTIEVLSKYGDDAARIIRTYGDDGLTAVYYYGDELIELVSKYGDETVDVVVKYGDNGFDVMKMGAKPKDIIMVDNIGITPNKLKKILEDKPDPSTYLSNEYINEHLSKFHEGVTRIQASVPDRPVGPPEGTFVMPKSTADELITKANGDVRKLEELLGFPNGYLGDAPVRVDIKEPTGLRMPRGDEPGAIDGFWIPGGITSGGIPEAVIDQVPLDKIIVSSILLKRRKVSIIKEEESIMKRIFFDYGIEICKENEKIYLIFDDGRIVAHFANIEISKEDADYAMKGPKQASEIIRKYQRRKKQLNNK